MRLSIPYAIDDRLRLSSTASWIMLFVSIAYVVVISLVNVAAVAYEQVAYLGDAADFNSSNTLWYDPVVPAFERSRHRNCSAANIKLNDCMIRYFRDSPRYYDE
jgi:hypothetical protein